MKNLNKIFRKKLGVMIIAFTLILAASCVYLDSIEYPDELVAGEIATFTMNTHVEVNADTAAEEEKLVIAILMPTSWNAAANSTITYTSSMDEGVQNMSLIPDSELPAGGNGEDTWSEHIYGYYGMGPNIAGDMEWVVYQSDNIYNIPGGETESAVVTIETLVGDENLSAQLGFFVSFLSNGFNYNESDDDSRWKVAYTDCLPVTGSTTGDETTYCDDLAVNNTKIDVASAPYPNPFTSEINMKLGVQIGENFEVAIYDMMGKKVRNYEGKASTYKQEFSLSQNLDMSNLNSGMYIISVKSGSHNSNFRIIKN